MRNDRQIIGFCLRGVRQKSGGKGRFRYGIKFMNMSEADRDAIIHFIHRREIQELRDKRLQPESPSAPQ